MPNKYFSAITKKYQKPTALVAILTVATVGTYLLIGSHAAAPAPYASVNADKGTTTCGASVVPDSTASDGSSVVRFGACATGDEGAINMILSTDSSTDPYTNPSPPSTAYHSFFQQFFRGVVYDPFWRQNLSWFPNAWVYQDAYAIYNSSSGSTPWIEQHHPEWFLQDSSGNKLYIPYACGGSSCTQYAADFGNPGFVHWWLTGCDLNTPQQCDPNNAGGEEAAVAAGYKGLFVDDVNMDFTVGNGNGNYVNPIDPRTGTGMTQSAWRQYMANFMIQIRKAIPNKEIVHNAVWYEGGGIGSGNPDLQYLKSEVQSANYIDIERGIVDGGLQNGGGTFGIDSLFSYADFIHSLCAQDGNGNCVSGSVNVLYDSYAASLSDTEYNLAGYFLTSNGGDGVASSDSTMLPGSLWSGYSRDLGAARGARYTWNGLHRRDFANGIVLLNPPGGSQINIPLGGTYYDINASGQKVAVTSVTLNSSQGAVLTAQ